MKEAYHWNVYTGTMLHCNCKDVSLAECSALCIFDAHWFEVEHQSQCEALCFVILIDFSDECYMLSPYMNAIIQIGINKCIVQGYQCSIVEYLSRFKYYANTFCYFLIGIHYMR